MQNNKQLVLHPSEIAYIAVILEIVNAGRKTTVFKDPTVPLQILSFLGDRINLQSVKLYSNGNRFLEDLQSNFINGESIISFTLGIRQILVGLESMDTLLHFVDIIPSVFESDTSTSPNEVMAPTRICPDSSLGIYCRTFSAKWNCLSFETICQLYESFRLFISSIDTAGITCPPSSLPSLNSAETTQSQCFDDENMNVHSFLQQAEKAAENGDVYAAEKLLHRYFDFNGNDLLLSLSKSPVGSSPQSALSALCHSNDPQFSGTRHQQALLQLASMWTRNGHYTLAMSAVEQAMKTAHQRGDHGSVARALLLLYHVVNGLNSPEQGGTEGGSISVALTGAEEILRRCLDRCCSLGMHALASQAAILLAQLLSTQSLSWSQSSYLSDWLTNSEDENIGGSSDRNSAKNGSNVNGNNGIVKNIWTLLLSSLIGEAKICSQISSGLNIVEKNTSNIIPVVKVKNNSAVTYEEFKALEIQTAIVSINYWCRLGVPTLGELQCRRTIRQLLSMNNRNVLHISDDVLTNLCCMLANLTVESEFKDIDELLLSLKSPGCRKDLHPASMEKNNTIDDKITKKYDRNTNNMKKKDACRVALSMIRIAKNLSDVPNKIISKQYSENKLSNEIESTQVYIAILSSLVLSSNKDTANAGGFPSNDYGSVNESGFIDINNDGRIKIFDSMRSLRLAYQLVALTNNSSASVNEKMSSQLGSVTSMKNAKAYLLLIRIMNLNNRKNAKQLLYDMNKIFIKNRYHEQNAEAIALNALYSMIDHPTECYPDNTKLNDNRKDKAILQFYKALKIADTYHYSSIESLICKFAIIMDV